MAMQPGASRPSNIELLRALDVSLCERGVPYQAISRMQRRFSLYSSSAPIEELTLEMDDGSRLDLVFKDSSPLSRSRLALQAKPSFLVDPLREIEAYRALLAPAHLGTASYFGSWIDIKRETYWLFLERVDGCPLYEVGDEGVWAASVRWLAHMHTYYAPYVAHGKVHPRLIRVDSDYLRRFAERARIFVANRSGDTRAASRRLEHVFDRFDQVVTRLLALPKTVVHGELYPSNVMVERSPDQVRICAVDWEMSGVGPALLDLAALTAGDWPENEKIGLARSYYHALPNAGLLYGDIESFIIALAWCRLYLAVQWLGWSDSWTPPQEHRHDWTLEAILLADRLGLVGH